VVTLLILLRACDLEANWCKSYLIMCYFIFYQIAAAIYKHHDITLTINRNLQNFFQRLLFKDMY